MKKTKAKKTFILGAMILGISITASPHTSQAEVIETTSIQKTENSNSAAGCIASLLRSLSSSVPGLYFKANCARDRGSDRYPWEFIYKSNTFSGESDTSMEQCISDLATELNLNIPIIDISIRHRCHKNERIEGDNRDDNEPYYFWKFDLKYDLDGSYY